MHPEKVFSPAPNVIEGLAAVVEVTLTPSAAGAVAESLKPEVQRGSDRSVKASVEVEEEELILKLSAGEISDLRAGLNSYLSLMKAACETLIYAEG